MSNQQAERAEPLCIHCGLPRSGHYFANDGPQRCVSVWPPRFFTTSERERCEAIAIAHLDTSHLDTSGVDGDRIYRNGWRACAESIRNKIQAGFPGDSSTVNSDSPDSESSE